MTDFHIRTTCRLCASPDLERLLTLNDTPLANELKPFPEGDKVVKDSAAGAVGFFEQDRFPLHLVGCRVCGHVQLPVVVDPKRLFGPDYPYQSGTSPVFREHLRELAATLAGMVEPRAKVLDVACNDGTLVEEVRLHGMRSHGIDPASPQRTGYTRGFFTAAWAEAERRDGERVACITALNVFAHVDDLDDFTRGVKTLLEPGGLFVIEVAYLPDMVRKGIWDTVYHEHLAFHHLSPLVRFFRKHGMTMVDAHRIDSQGGSVRIFVKNWDGTFRGGDDGTSAQSERLQALLDDEARSQLWDGVRELKRRVALMARGLHEFGRKGDGRLVIYGAPAKLCTLLHATGKAEMVDYVVDDNPLKQGRYVPGTSIPILPTSVLHERKPKAVVIASWNFADDIMKRHADVDCEWWAPFGQLDVEKCGTCGGDNLGPRETEQTVRTHWRKCEDCGATTGVEERL